jgi:hypothetical protein
MYLLTHNWVWVLVLFFTCGCNWKKTERNLEKNLKPKKNSKNWNLKRNIFIKPDGHLNPIWNLMDLNSGARFHLSWIRVFNLTVKFFSQVDFLSNWSKSDSLTSLAPALRFGDLYAWYVCCIVSLLSDSHLLPLVWLWSLNRDTGQQKIWVPCFLLYRVMLRCLLHFVVMFLSCSQCPAFLVASSSVIPLHLSLRPMLRAVVLKCWCRKRAWVTYAWTLLLLLFKRPLVVCACA